MRLGLRLFLTGLMLIVWTQMSIASMKGSARGSAAMGAENNRLLQAVRMYLKERTQATGTLDLYDNKYDQVRNLRTLKFHEGVSQAGDVTTVRIDYRDINSGAIVGVDVLAKETASGFQVTDVIIKEVKELKESAEKAQVIEYTDKDIQQVMTGYVKQQTKFTGYMSLFDEENNKLRKIEFVKLDPQVRKLGVLNISRAQFKDMESGETLGIDITVENRKGQAKLQSLRIRTVSKP